MVFFVSMNLFLDRLNFAYRHLGIHDELNPSYQGVHAADTCDATSYEHVVDHPLFYSRVVWWVNASFWALGLGDKIQPDLNVDFVGNFNPSPYSTGAFFREQVKPSDLAGWDSEVMPSKSKMGGLDNPTEYRNSRIDRALLPRTKVVEYLKKNHPGFDRSKYKPAPPRKGKKK